MATKIAKTYTTKSLSHANPTAVAVATTGSTTTTPAGYTTTAQADALVTAVNNIINDVANVKQVLNQVIAELEARNEF